MNFLNEYIENAIQFERLASQEKDPELKSQLERQAVAYRKLVAERAARYGMPPPSEP